MSLECGTYAGSPAVWTPASPTTLQNTVTDTSGDYCFNEVPSDLTCRVCTSAHPNSTYELIYPNASLCKNMTVPPGTTVNDIDFGYVDPVNCSEESGSDENYGNECNIIDIYFTQEEPSNGDSPSFVNLLLNTHEFSVSYQLQYDYGYNSCTRERTYESYGISNVGSDSSFGVLYPDSLFELRKRALGGGCDLSPSGLIAVITNSIAENVPTNINNSVCIYNPSKSTVYAVQNNYDDNYKQTFSECRFVEVDTDGVLVDSEDGMAFIDLDSEYLDLTATQDTVGDCPQFTVSVDQSTSSLNVGDNFPFNLENMTDINSNGAIDYLTHANISNGSSHSTGSPNPVTTTGTNSFIVDDNSALNCSSTNPFDNNGSANNPVFYTNDQLILIHNGNMIHKTGIIITPP